MNNISAGIQSMPLFNGTHPIHFKNVNCYMGCMTVVVGDHKKVFDNFIPIVDVMVGCKEDVLFNMSYNILRELEEHMINDHHYPEGSKVVIVIADDKKEFVMELESKEKCL